MSKKKRRGGKSHLNDFKIDSSGRYYFQGYYYEWKEEPRIRKSKFRLVWLSCGIGAGAVIVAGCVPNPWVNVPYALIPYVISLIIMISLMWGMVRFSMEGFVQRSYVYEKSTSNLHLRAMFSALFLGASAVCDVIAVFAAGIDAPLYQSVFFIIPAVTGVVSLLLTRRFLRTFIWEKKA